MGYVQALKSQTSEINLINEVTTDCKGKSHSPKKKNLKSKLQQHKTKKERIH